MAAVFRNIHNQNHHLLHIDGEEREFMKLVFDGVPAITAIKQIWGSLEAFQHYVNRKILES